MSVFRKRGIDSLQHLFEDLIDYLGKLILENILIDH